jgi:predicted nucleic acid-binding protein
VCRDPADDYLVALARREMATIITGDRDLLLLVRLSPRDRLAG